MKLRDKKEEKRNIAVKISPASSQMSWKLLIAMKSGKILSPLFPPSSCRGRSCSFLFFSLCAPVLVLVMGKEEVHGGNLNNKAHTMADYLKRSGY